MKRYVCALLALLAVHAATAGVIFSEDFEGGVNQDVIPVGILSGTQFEVISGNVDHIKDDADPASPYAVMCGAGGSCIDTTGSQSDPSSPGRGEMRTINEISFLPGLYYISFNLQGWSFDEFQATASIQVLIPGLLDVTLFRDGSGNPHLPERIPFEVNSAQAVKLTFRDLGGNFGFAGAILDDVEVGTATPEPSSLLLLLPALAGIAFWRRRSGALAAGK
ncbi:MAG: PEP-CTERM sorting domain-containing protein [Bryobacterales bacterium]|nr:PEP-CTERM sorting domain-containing protein [Bryobacterales bacterium]